jgi:hypothetical protein
MSMKSNCGLQGLAALAALLLGAAPALAGVPLRLTEQGRLYDTAGNPLMGNASVVFTLYDAPVGGNVLWTEVQTVAADTGYFSAELGAISPIPLSVWDGAERYLGITVGTDPEMTPRQPTPSTPYAIVAEDVVGDIHPASISIQGQMIVDANGNWVGPASGLAGPPGPTGPQGPVGGAGPAGPAGPQGPAGIQGAIGPTGPQGATGLQGALGAAGPQGALGPTGPQGASGALGATGSQGLQGVQGPLGPTGALGPTGGSGAVGPTGPQGALGPIGATGPIGPAGVVGAVGPTGPQGATGPMNLGSLSLQGGTMAGGIDMSGFTVANIPPPGSAGDAVPKSYVDTVMSASNKTFYRQLFTSNGSWALPSGFSSLVVTVTVIGGGGGGGWLNGYGSGGGKSSFGPASAPLLSANGGGGGGNYYGGAGLHPGGVGSGAVARGGYGFNQFGGGGDGTGTGSAGGGSGYVAMGTLLVTTSQAVTVGAGGGGVVLNGSPGGGGAVIVEWWQ